LKFGHLFVPMSLDPEHDLEAIDNCLYEAELAEDLGLDAIWISEHHFGGGTAYADPMVFAGALAARTNRVKIGFGILELGLHHPVRVAVQTALLDNLCRGRLIVGTGSGSRFNAFEYIGFGTTAETARACIGEAEDLLVRTWTGNAKDFIGQYWQVSVPDIRPRPFQKPHPPIARAVVSEDSVMAMARIGRPILINSSSIENIGRLLKTYRDTMSAAGFDDLSVELAMDQTWVWRDTYVAETDTQAMDEFLPVFERAKSHMAGISDKWNPKDPTIPKRPAPLPRDAYGASPSLTAAEAMVGSPKRVSEHVAMLQDVGVRNLMLTHMGLVSREQTTSYLNLLSKKVIPLFS
jgi:alkanesulfonate monooxygenase SsuD/methylene tetrahydromethanopterin reductase-like flavin-dependent oxidoreductase (luciferase family)